MRTSERSSEDDGRHAVVRLVGDRRCQALRSSVELVVTRRRPVRRVVVADATQLAHRSADHDVDAVHARTVADATVCIRHHTTPRPFHGPFSRTTHSQ